jgi:hypothetical protein
MAHDRLAIHVHREVRCDQRGQFLRHIGPHMTMGSKGRLRRVNIETRAQPEIIGTGRIVRYAFVL